MNKGVCKLCGEEKFLIRKAHIYPQFMYEGVFDDTNKTILQYLHGSSKSKTYQTGFYDRDILCQHCDNVVLGSLERYAASILYKPSEVSDFTIISKIERQDLTTMHVKNVNFKKFKLFILNLLWKAHISNNPFFKEVDVSALEPTFRQMLLNGDPGSEDDFQICITRLDRPDGRTIDMIPNPIINLKQLLKVAIFIVGGYVYAIELEKNSGFAMFPQFSLKASNEILIPRLSLGAARAYLIALGIPDKHADYFTGTKRSIDLPF